MNRRARCEVRRAWLRCGAAWVLLLVGSAQGTPATNELDGLVSDRAAIERVYYNHRLGQKPPFEETLPPAALESLVRQDLKKEAVLRKTYDLAITDALLEAEVQRINTTTRAPEVLAEIKAALGNDPVRFAQVFAKPILVERLLRERFENNDALHARQRREVEEVRSRLLAARPVRDGSRGDLGAGKFETNPKTEIRDPKPEMAASSLVALLKAGHSNEVSETTWQLGPRPAEKEVTASPDEMEIKKRFGPDARVISSPRGTDSDRKSYFVDLPPGLQNVLRVQLRHPGDVTAVIETPGVFLLYLAREKTAASLSVACLSLAKRSYEQWLREQP